MRLLLNPDDGASVSSSASALRLAAGELRAALADREEQIRLRPALPHGYVARAIVHVTNREYRRAAADMQQAITKRGDDDKREVNAVFYLNSASSTAKSRSVPC